MPGPNTTGVPKTEDYNLGRGIVYFASIDATTGKPKGYRDLGNAPEFNISIETETLEHQSSRGGLKVVDKEVVISQKINLSLSLDELNHENLALLFSGSKASHTNVAIAGFAEFTMILAANLQKNTWYDIVNSTGERAYDIDAADFAAETTNVAPVALVVDVDYTLDLEMGRIFIKDTAKITTALTNVEGIACTLTADVNAKTVSEVQVLTATNIAGALKFIGANPANADKQTEYQFHKVSLKAEGDFSLIGDEFTTMNFTGVAERNVLADANSPSLTVRNVD